MSHLDEIFDYAIEKEQEAHDFYVSLAGKMKNPTVAEIFKGFANEEAGHKRKLEALKAGRMEMKVKEGVKDLKIGDYLVEVKPGAEMTFQDALIIAMKREKSSFKLYSDLAEITNDAESRQIFLGLAQEEAKHKLRFELEYDEMILKDN